MIDIQELINKCNSLQTLHAAVGPLKIKAMEEALTMFPPSIKHVIDIGYVEAYEPAYASCNLTVSGYNLPEHDMHKFDIKCDAVILRHVLEHSPIPMLPLVRIHEYLNEKGYIVVVVPKLTEMWSKYDYHFTVLDLHGWLHLFKHSGVNIVSQQTGTWRDDENGIECRFLLQK